MYCALRVTAREDRERRDWLTLGFFSSVAQRARWLCAGSRLPSIAASSYAETFPLQGGAVRCRRTLISEKFTPFGKHHRRHVLPKRNVNNWGTAYARKSCQI